jgi:hypothetical protein
VAWAADVVGAGAAVGVALGAYAVGALVGGLLGKDDDEPSAAAHLPALHQGTEQEALVANLGRYIEDLRALREAHQPEVVVDPAIEALVATEHAHGTAVRVAAAIDGLDVALARSGGPSSSGEVRDAVRRMEARRTALLDKLRGTVDEVAEVYTKLLEMSAAVSALDVDAGATEEVAKVNDSLDTLRQSLSELEAQAD